MTDNNIYLEAYNLGLASVGLPPTRHVGEDGDEWDVTFVEHAECARMMRAAGISAFAMSEPWQDAITKGSRILLVDKCYRIAGDLRKHHQAGEILTCRTPLPYLFPSEFLRARMEVSGVDASQTSEVRELWRICTHATQTHLAGDVEPTGHPGALPRPKTPAVVAWNDVASAPAPEWLLDSLIAKDSLTMLASASTSGKSLLVLDWMLRMIHGMNWLGRHMRAGSVLYLCGEGAAGIGGRIRGWQAANPNEKPRTTSYLVFSQGIPTLSTPAGCVELRLMLDDLVRKHGHAPDVVVVDTLSQAFGEGDENDAATVAPALKALTDLRQQFHCAILILHHITKASGTLSLNSVRGSGAFTANVDAVLGISVQDDIRTLRTLKLKDGEMAPPISFQVVGRETGRYLSDGATEKAPVIVPAADTSNTANQASDVDRRIYTTIGMAGREGLTRSSIENLTGIESRIVFESVCRMEREGTIVKGDGAAPRYYWPGNAPKNPS